MLILKVSLEGLRAVPPDPDDLPADSGPIHGPQEPRAGPDSMLLDSLLDTPLLGEPDVMPGMGKRCVEMNQVNHCA